MPPPAAPAPPAAPEPAAPAPPAASSAPEHADPLLPEHISALLAQRKPALLPEDIRPTVPGPAPAAGRAPGRGGGSERSRTRRRVPVIVTVLVVLIAAGAGALAWSGSHSGPHPRSASGSRSASGFRGSGGTAVATAAAARGQAASWVSHQVSHSAIVECDPAMCAVLQADGLPAANLTDVSSNTADPLGADVVVATPAVRSQFGQPLASVYAPAVLARFGSGAAEIDIRVVAPGGAAVYRTALSQDVAARKRVSAQLLKTSRIQVATAARAQLADGQVDARLLLTLAALAHVHPLRVLSFGAAGPRADPGLPLCSAELDGSYYPASMSQGGYVSWLQKFLAAQRPPYNSQVSTATQPGKTVVTVRFAEPSPLGLLKDG